VSQRVHGLRYADWVALYSFVDWRGRITRALRAIALDPRADGDDRLSALRTLSTAMAEGTLPQDYSFPEFSRDTVLAIVDGVRLSWWQRIGLERHARARTRQLYAAQCALHSIKTFEDAAKAEQAAENARPMPAASANTILS
jgi:hypothetical protein